MATGSQALESVRAAIEASEGAATTPTRFLYVPQGGMTLQDKHETILLQLAGASFDDVYDVLSGIEDVQFVVTDVPINSEDFGFWMSAFDANGLSAAPTGPTDTSAYTRTGAPSQSDSTVSATGVKSLHIQYAPTDLLSTRGWSLPGLVGEDLTVTFRKHATGNDTGARFSARFRTAGVTVPITVFTGTPTDRLASNWMIGNGFKAYVDPTTIGSTNDTDVTEMTFHLNRPAVFHDGADGTGQHTSMHRPQAWMAEMSYIKKFSSVTELDAYKGTLGIRPLRKIRGLVEGGLAGAATVKHSVRMDFMGKIVDDGDTPQRTNGLYYKQFSARGVKDATWGASWRFVTVNAVSAAYTTA